MRRAPSRNSCSSWYTRHNGDKPETLIQVMLAYGRRSKLDARLHGIDMLQKASEEVERVHDLGGPATPQRLEEIFYQLRLARQGR